MPWAVSQTRRSRARRMRLARCATFFLVGDEVEAASEMCESSDRRSSESSCAHADRIGGAICTEGVGWGISDWLRGGMGERALVGRGRAARERERRGTAGNSGPCDGDGQRAEILNKRTNNYYTGWRLGEGYRAKKTHQPDRHGARTIIAAARAEVGGVIGAIRMAS